MLDDVGFSKEINNQIVYCYSGIGEADSKASYEIKSGLYLSSNSTLEGKKER